MAKRRSAGPLEPGPPQIPPAQGIELLRGQIEKGKSLLTSRPIGSNDYSSWELLTRNFLEKALGANSPNVASVIDVGKYGSFPMEAGEDWWEHHRAKSLETQLKQLDGLVELLVTEVQLSVGDAPHVTTAANGHRIFLVHGHNEAVLHEVARFLERLA